MRHVDIALVYNVLKEFVKKFRLPIVDVVEARHKKPFCVLVSTILSARTKDTTTAAACKKLFAKVQDPVGLEKLSAKQVENLIFPVGFYKTKARHLKQLPGVLHEVYGGKIPDTVEELVKLPGVGRKTANLVVAIAFKKPAICVDTHVHRIMNRLGYVKTKAPFGTEMALRQKLPKKYWPTINSMLVAFGQNHCVPISPYCSACPVRGQCNRVGVERSR